MPAQLYTEDTMDEESAEAWARREAARRRQIMIGKARPEYHRYIAEVPFHKRGAGRPVTPDPADRSSKRQFDRALGEWRRKLHEFDVEGAGVLEVSGTNTGAVLHWIGAVSVNHQVQQETPQATPSPRRRHRGSGRSKRNSAQEPATSENQSSYPPLPPQEEPQPVQAQDYLQQVTMPQPHVAVPVVQLRLADQFPEPPAMSVPNHEDIQKDNAANLREPLALLGQFPWPPLPMGPDAALKFLLAASSVGICPLLPSCPDFSPTFAGQTQPASNPATPCRPRNNVDFNDGETPPPMEMPQAQYAQPIMNPVKLEVDTAPREDVAFFTCDNCLLTGESSEHVASNRCSSPPPSKMTLKGRWCDISGPIPCTPPRHCPAMARSPPASVVKTPGLLVPETPSPNRFHHQHHQMVLPPLTNIFGGT